MLLFLPLKRSDASSALILLNPVFSAGGQVGLTHIKHSAPRNDPDAGVDRYLILQLIRAVHTAIYVVMAASTMLLVYAGVTGATGAWLWWALALLAIETVVFAGFGFNCPLTGLAVEYGARTGHVFDTFLPERATRYTFRFFGTLMALGLLLLGLRWSDIIV